MAAQPSSLVMEQDKLAGEVAAATRELAHTDLATFWNAHKEDVLKWARRMQKQPYCTLGFVRNMGKFVEKLAPKIDAISQ